MIISIEGPRNTGKSHLLNSFLEKNENPNVIYYKFLFAKYIDQFNMRDQESGPGMHYFSLGNILSIFELNQTLFKDKIILFDRCIHSAYVWAIYRERLGREKLLAEYSKILNSELYTNCSTFYRGAVCVFHQFDVFGTVDEFLQYTLQKPTCKFR